VSSEDGFIASRVNCMRFDGVKTGHRLLRADHVVTCSAVDAIGTIIRNAHQRNRLRHRTVSTMAITIVLPKIDQRRDSCLRSPLLPLLLSFGSRSTQRSAVWKPLGSWSGLCPCSPSWYDLAWIWIESMSPKGRDPYLSYVYIAQPKWYWYLCPVY
jgi:hypothetical protein